MSHPHAEAWSSPQARYLGLSDEEMGLPAAAADAASEDGASDGRQSAVMHPVSIDSSIDGTGRRSAEDEPLIATQCNGVLHDSLPFTQPLAARDKLCMSAACVMVLAVLATVGTAVGLRMEAESRLDAMLHLLRGATFEPGINGTWKMQVTPEQADEYDMRDAEVTLLGTLHVRIANRSMYMTEQLLRGAHVVVRGDGGYFYRMFSRFEGAYTRTSSHYSSRVQYGIPEGRYLRTLLFGTVGESTWLQLEGSPWDPLRRPWASYVHLLNYMQYVMCDCQVGPLGSNLHTDRRPLCVAFSPTLLFLHNDAATAQPDYC